MLLQHSSYSSQILLQHSSYLPQQLLLTKAAPTHQLLLTKAARTRQLRTNAASTHQLLCSNTSCSLQVLFPQRCCFHQSFLFLLIYRTTCISASYSQMLLLYLSWGFHSLALLYFLHREHGSAPAKFNHFVGYTPLRIFTVGPASTFTLTSQPCSLRLTGHSDDTPEAGNTKRSRFEA
jgi:hypothetical protein